MNLFRRLFPKLICPACGGRVERLSPSLSVGALAAEFGAQVIFEIVWFIVAAIIAAVTFRLFGQIAGFLVVLAIAFAIDRRLVRYHCLSCKEMFSRVELRAQSPAQADAQPVDAPDRLPAGSRPPADGR